MFTPAGYRILLEMEEVEEKTKGGIYLPEQTRDANEAANERGRVVAIGEFAYKEYPAHWCKVDDTVTIARYAGKIEIDETSGKKYRVVNDLDIHCIVRCTTGQA